MHASALQVHASALRGLAVLLSMQTWACAGPRSQPQPREVPRAELTSRAQALSCDGGVPKVIVTLTFDDSIDDIVGPGKDELGVNQLGDDIAWLVGQAGDAGAQAGGILTDADDAGLETACPNVTVDGGRQANEQLNCDVPASFFLNWPRLDEPQFLSLAKVQQMESWGHEIGGHSSHHHIVPRLESDSKTTEELDEQRRQICWDRRNLTGIARSNGVGTFNVTTFAYPRGEYEWLGEPALQGRYGDPTPALDGLETRAIVDNDCGYRAARRTGGAADTAECSDGNPATPCRWAEHYPFDDPSDVWAIRTPSSVTPPPTVKDGGVPRMVLDYPPLPPNDLGAAGYDRPEEYERRAGSLKGWVDNAIANPVSCTQKNWVIYVFHSICYLRKTPGCNAYGIALQDFQDLITWLRQKRLAGQIEIKTMAQVLGHTTERPVNTPDAGPQPTLVRNGGIFSDGDINHDYLPDCFQLDGVNARSTFADALQATPLGDGGVDAGTAMVSGANGSRYYAWLWLDGKSTADGYLVTRQDHTRCALRVSPGNSYRVSFYVRKPDPARTCPFRDKPDAGPCPVLDAGTGAVAAGLAASLAESPALDGEPTGDELPFGAQGSDYEEYWSDDPLADAGGLQLAALAATAADGGEGDASVIEPVYAVTYRLRRSQATGSMVRDGHWLSFSRKQFPNEQPPTSMWQKYEFVVPFNSQGSPLAVGSGLDSMSFGVYLARNGATGQVALDVDDFSYCRLTNNNPTDPVPACPDSGVP